MIRRSLPLLLLLLAAPSIDARLPESPSRLYVEQELIVVYESRQVAKATGDRIGLPVRRRLLHGRAELIELPAFATLEGGIAALSVVDGVRRVERNRILHLRQAPTPDDPLFDDLWGLLNTGQADFAIGGPDGRVGADMNLLPAWDPLGDGSFTRTGDGSVVLAIIDDAFDTAHVDLAANFIAGRDSAGNDDDPTPDDNRLQPHGTLVAGAAAAVGNDGTGIAGAIWDVQLIPLKVSRIQGAGNDAEVILDTAAVLDAYQQAIDRGADIVNASFGGPVPSQTEFELLRDMRDAGILFVTSAGNNDSNLDASTANYPANYELDNIIAVAASDRRDDIASFSVFGPTRVEIAAPGRQVVTTRPGNGYALAQNAGVDGTSFSSPYAAGVAALIKNYVPTADADEIKARLIESGTSLSNAHRFTRAGRIDAAAAIDMTPGPSLLIRDFRYDDSATGNGNGLPDPGEALDLVVTIENIWLAATNVTASAARFRGTGLDIDGSTLTVGALPGAASRPGNTAELRFPITDTANANDHEYVEFSIRIQADGYDRTRFLRTEVGTLLADTTVEEQFVGVNIDTYDEFHAWHITLDQDVQRLTITTSTDNDQDIDLLVRRGAPPEYLITIGIDPESGAPGVFYADDDTLISGAVNGNESISIANAEAGTYHVVIVNFAQETFSQPYTLRASVIETADGGGSGGGTGGGTGGDSSDGGGGGGSLGLMLSGLLAAAGLVRRRRQP